MTLIASVARLGPGAEYLEAVSSVVFRRYSAPAAI
jgi:hypothetical protein